MYSSIISTPYQSGSDQAQACTQKRRGRSERAFAVPSRRRLTACHPREQFFSDEILAKHEERKGLGRRALTMAAHALKSIQDRYVYLQKTADLLINRKSNLALQRRSGYFYCHGTKIVKSNVSTAFISKLSAKGAEIGSLNG